MNPAVIVHSGVQIPDDAQLGAFVILGLPFGDDPQSTHPTVIGARALIRSHTVIYAGNVIGDRFHSGHGVLIREENVIHDDVSIGSSTVIEHHVQIGHRVRIHSSAFIPEYSVLEDDCWIGPCVVLTNAKYPRSPNAKQSLQGVRIGHGAKIGANATLLPGIVIGAGALVGAGSVVTKDVSPGTVVAGNPAKFVKSIASLPY